MSDAEHGGRTSWVPDVETNRPSLANLDERQQGSLDDLVDGFVDRQHVIRWVRELGVVTLGRLPDRFVRDVPLSRAMLSLLVITEERAALGVAGRTPDLDDSREFRERLAGRILPYHRDAIRDFRESAVEYLDDDARPDPQKAKSVAHRPSLSELDARQAAALDALLGGRIRSERDLVGWSRSLNLATEGELGDTSDGRGFVERVVDEPGTRSVIIASDDKPATHAEARVRFAAYHLLPAFNAGVRALWNRAGEDTRVEREGLSSTSL